MDDHIPEPELMIFAFDPAAAPRRDSIEAHITACASCRTTVAFMRATDEELADIDVWEPTAGSGTMQSLLALAAQIEAEDADADELLKPLLEAPATAAWTQIHDTKKYLTGGVVRRLSAHAHNVCEREPLDALTFADAAITVAETLPDDTYAARAVYELRGTAWKERANALRLLGRFEAALDALAKAERAFSELTSSSLGLAIVAFVRAAVFFEQQCYAEAVVAATNAERAFAHLGDDNRRMQALFLRADIKYEQQEIGEAISLFQQVLDHGVSLDNTNWIARASYALGNCHADRNDIGNATLHFQRALAIFRELGPTTECVRAEWGIARVLLLAGKNGEAIRRLRYVTAEFEMRGMVTDAALAGLDTADAFMTTGRMQEIAELAAHLFRVFTTAGMLQGALTAIAYMKEAAAAGTLTSSDVNAVRTFLRRAEHQPELLFVAPSSNSC